MFYAPRFIFGGTEGVGSCFNVLRARTRFRRYQGHRVPFFCFALPESFSAVPGASDPVFMFGAPGLIFGGTEGVRSRFHVFRSRTRFGRCGRRQVPFSCFALLNTFLTVPRASGPVFMLFAPGLFFGGAKCIGSRFHVLCTLTNFQQYRGRVLRARTRFQRYRVHRVPFSCFVIPSTFSLVRRASSLDFMLCALGLIFDGTEGVESRFHFLHAQSHFRRYLCDPFSRAPHRRWAMGCGRRTRRSLPSVHLFNAG
jgi:hypothetical protein